MKTAQLVVNESYWQLFEKRQFRSQNFLVPDIGFLSSDKISNLKYTQNLGILLKVKDKDQNVTYGSEIKTNGSSRSGRIPLVRISKDNQSIWKVASNIRDVDKTITDLDNLLYFLEKSRTDSKLKLPTKTLIANINESEYLQQEHLIEYVKKVVEKNNIVWISSEFLTNFLGKFEKVNISELTNKRKSILTKEAFL